MQSWNAWLLWPDSLPGPKIEKNKSRFKISISLAIFNHDLQNSPENRGLVGGSLENFKILIFFSLWALRARANRFADPRKSPDSRESFQGSRTEPLLCEPRFGGLKIANRRFEAIRASRLKRHENMGFFARIDSRESIRFALRIAGPSAICTSLIRCSFVYPLPQCFWPRRRKLRPWFERNSDQNSDHHRLCIYQGMEKLRKWSEFLGRETQTMVWVWGVLEVGVDEGSLMQRFEVEFVFFGAPRSQIAVDFAIWSTSLALFSFLSFFSGCLCFFPCYDCPCFFVAFLFSLPRISFLFTKPCPSFPWFFLFYRGKSSN